jgi:hypothetical protein
MRHAVFPTRCCFFALEAHTLVSAGLLFVAMPSAERHGEHVEARAPPCSVRRGHG